MKQSINYVEQWKTDYQFRLNIAKKINIWCSKYFLCEFDLHTLLKLVHPHIIELSSEQIANLYKHKDDEFMDDIFTSTLLNHIAEQNFLSQFIVKNKKILQHIHPLFSEHKNKYETQNNWYSLHELLEKQGKNKAKLNDIVTVLKEFNRLKNTKGNEILESFDDIYRYFERYRSFDDDNALKTVQNYLNLNPSFKDIEINNMTVDIRKNYIQLYHFIHFHHLGSYPCTHLFNVLETYKQYPSNMWLLTHTSNKLENTAFISWIHTLSTQTSGQILNKNIDILKNILNDYGDMAINKYRNVNKALVINNIIGAITNTKSAVHYLSTPNPQLENIQLMKNIDVDSYLDTLIFLDPYLKTCFESDSSMHMKSWAPSLRNRVRIFEKIQTTPEVNVEEFDLLF